MNKVSKQIEIKAPVGNIFDLFNSFTHFPRWMKGVKKVEQVVPGRMRWTVQAPDGTLGEWETELVELEPGRRVAWRSITGNIAAQGEASFEETKQDITTMRLSLGYDALPEQADKLIAATFNDNLAERLEEDLIWFRLLAEREAQADSNIRNGQRVTAAPLLARSASRPANRAANKSPVHFETFSSIRRAGQMIRPARLVTSFLSGVQVARRQRATHSPIVVNLDNSANRRADDEMTALTTRAREITPVPVHRSVLASVIVIGLLLVSSTGWIAGSKWPVAPVNHQAESTSSAAGALPANNATRPAAAAGIEATTTFEQEEALTAAAAAAALDLVRTSKGKAAAKRAGKRARGRRISTRWVTVWLNPVVKPFARKKQPRRR